MKKATILALVAIAIVGTVVLKKQEQQTVTEPSSHTAGIPRLLDLGAHGCTACEMLVPVLNELRTEYADQLQVDFIDVWENEGVAEKYSISIIPVQLFYDADGNEIARHEGFISKADILAQFKTLGITFNTEE